ncbi:MAG: hypothetical protein K1X28_09560 [Parachlamydiales bacterium]|nr:hypothetical protein [Parachlamydiales bacterium]
MIWIFAAALLASGLSEDEGLRRVRAHLLIDDQQSALREAESLALQYPESLEVQKILIEAFAYNGFEEQALDSWNKLTFKKPDLLYDRHLLEELAWGVLKKGTRSTQYGVRLAATIGSFLTRDTRAVPVLLKMMRDSNAVIRSVAVQMASAFRDAPLKDEIARLMREERVWIVRLEVIKAAGLLKMKELAPDLQTLVQSDKTPMEEKQIAIASLLEMYDQITMEEFKTLSSSNRAGLRHLACMIATHFKMEEAREEVIRLIQDSHPAVRIAALNAFGMIYQGKESEISAALQDSDPAVAITACWAAFLIQSPLAEKNMERWLSDSLPENRRLAAAALAASGNRGIALAVKTLKESADPYVKVNLALGLLGQRVEVKKCCDLIAGFMETEKRMVMVDQKPNPLFEILAPSQVRHNDQIPNFPEAQDQMTRLNLVSMLALVEDPRALPALKSFLQRKNWGVTGVAAATLLHEGDESALEVVKQLVTDSDPNVRLQACLVLAMFGKDESVLLDLQGAYAGADHEKKLYILEALGKIGNVQSFSFLAGCLKEPFPILRVAAAAALIQSVNR